MELLEDLIEAAEGFTRHPLWRDPLPGKPPRFAWQAFLAARRLEAAAKARKELARGVLMEWLEAEGDEDEKGSRHASIDDCQACRQAGRPASPDVGLVRKLLAAKGIPEAGVIVDRLSVTKVADPSVLARLVATGALGAEEVDGCSPLSFSFTTKETADTKELLEDMWKGKP